MSSSSKLLYCIRHGIAEHNINYHKFGSSTFCDPNFTDTSLVQEGFIQAQTLRNTWPQLKDIELAQIFQTSVAIKANKKEKLTSLVRNMTEIEKQGLNLFEVSKNINDIGVKSISFEDIAKAVVEEPSLKSDVLESTKKGISPADFTNQLEVIAEAEKLGIAESTANVLDVSAAAGFSKDVMPTLETMRGDFFDAEAHNAAMEEMAAEIQSGGLGEETGAAEAAASYSEQDRADQKAQSEADCTGSCAGDTESGD